MTKISLIIYIPGALVPKSRVPVVGALLNTLLALLNVFFQFDDFGDKEAWSKYLDSNHNKYIELNWDRRPSLSDIPAARLKLEGYLAKYSRNYDVTIVANSLGSEVVLGLDAFNGISRIVLLSPVYKSREINNISVLELYSSIDNYALLAKKLFWPLSSRSILRGNLVTRTDLAPLRHSEFLPETCGQEVMSVW